MEGGKGGKLEGYPSVLTRLASGSSPSCCCAVIQAGRLDRPRLPESPICTGGGGNSPKGGGGNGGTPNGSGGAPGGGSPGRPGGGSGGTPGIPGGGSGGIPNNGGGTPAGRFISSSIIRLMRGLISLIF